MPSGRCLGFLGASRFAPFDHGPIGAPPRNLPFAAYTGLLFHLWPA